LPLVEIAFASDVVGSASDWSATVVAVTRSRSISSAVCIAGSARSWWRYARLWLQHVTPEPGVTSVVSRRNCHCPASPVTVNIRFEAVRRIYRR
jgi:hypothetical protein